MGSGFFSQDNPPPAEQSPAGPGPGNVVLQEPTGVDGATASFFGRGAAPALQAFEEDAKAAAGEAAASAAAAAASAVASAASAGEALNVATGVDAFVDQAEAAKNAAQASATNSANSATAAAGSASAANTSATQASTSATNAGNSATAAATSATNSATSAASAVSSASQAASSANSANAAATTATAKAAEATASATNAANSAASASTSASTATTKAAEAATSASAAAGSATTAGASATAAGTSATNAANSASAAGTSATNAAASATTATTKASESSTSATNAASSATYAAGSATTATTKASEASASAANAAASATTATTKASEASTSATNAASSATAAGTSATNAANSASAAGTSVTNAANSATAAANSATAAAGSATAAAGSAANASSAQSAAESARDATLAAFDSFDDRYLGTKISNPTADNDGNALVAGALYFNSTAGEMRVWTGSVWTAAYVSGAGVLLQANNLSDLANASTARTNLGLGNVENKSSATIRSEITSGNVTTALGYTPYNSSNPSGYISGITSGQVTTALGYTPYNATNPAGYITSAALSAYLPLTGGALNVGGVSNTHQFNYNESGGEIQLIDSTGAGPILLDNISGLARLLKVGSGNMAIGTTSTGSLRLQTVDTERMRIDGSGNVGIGTSSPGTRLDVAGGILRSTASSAFNPAITVRSDASATNWARLDFQNQNIAGEALIYLENTGSFVVRNNIAGQPIRFLSEASEKMRVDSSGNVGIGTTSATSRLRVSDTSPTDGIIASFNNTTNALGVESGIRLEQGSSAQLRCDLVTYRAGANAGLDFAIKQSDNTGTSQTRFYITELGNVGIGTTTPGSLLTLSSTQPRMDFVETDVASANTTRLVQEANIFRIQTVNNGVFIAEDYAIERDAGGPIAHRWRIQNTERMRITNAGNVGIGTSSPSYQATVLGLGQDTAALTDAGNKGGSLYLQATGITGGSGGALLFGTTFGNQTPFAAIKGLVTDGATNTIGDLAFSTRNAPTDSALTERMRILRAGNVGIGTSAPQGLLHVVAGTDNSILVRGPINYATGGSIYAVNSANSAITPMEFGASSYFFSGGNVGIGTSAPASLLHVKRGSNAIEVYPAGTWATRAINATDGSGENGLLVGNRWAGTGSTVFEVGSIYGGGTGSWYSYYRIDGTGQSIWSNGGTERMRLDTSGRLGIGTSAPGKTLDLVGQFRVSGSAASGYALLEYGTSATAANNWHVGSEGDGTFRWYNGNFGAGTERMRITSAGNVGIGTSSPGAKLDVTTASGANIVVSRSSAAGYAAFQRIAPAGQWTYDFYTINGVEAARITVTDTNIMAFATGSAAAERMRIDASGNVGIGTSSPGTKLDVVGDIRGTNAIFLGAGQNNDNRIEVGTGRTGNNFAYLDLIGDTTYTDYGLRLIRGNGGANTTSEINHRGTGDFILNAVDAAALRFLTSGSERMRIAAGGETNFNGLLVGRSSASTDVNTANDTGSFSVRGSTTTIAAMSFHRTGAYAINMGLGTDNVFRIGGWSASSNAFQMDGSGNLTMLGNVTAYSDARIKKDVETIDSALDLVSKMRGVRYTRIDTKKRGVGVIAQEMLEVCPEVVQQGVGDDDTLSVAYGNLVGVLIEAVKELKAEVETLKGKNP